MRQTVLDTLECLVYFRSMDNKMTAPSTVAQRDAFCLSALVRVCPPALVDEVIERCGCKEERVRLLPARFVLYYVLGLALFTDSGYREVMRQLVDGLHPVVDDIPHWHVPGNASIVEARARLGPEPPQELFRVVAQPLGHAGDRNVWYHGRWRVMAIDGLRLDVADTEANDTAFERPGHSRGVGSAYPQVQVVGLAETGSHAYVGLALGGCRQGETTLARELLPCLQPDMLCLADRNFFSYDLWRAVGERGAERLWRVKKNLRLDPVRRLADGSYLAYVYPSPVARKHQRDGILVRVIEFVVDDPGRGTELPVYRLITSLLDPGAAPAKELTVLYCHRWEFETANDELKTHLRGAGRVLRSKLPDGVRQEVYAHFLTHYAVRALMYEAADQAHLDPDRLSFINALRVVRRRVIAQSLFSPG